MPSVRYPQGNLLYRDLKKEFPIIAKGEGIYLYDTDGKKYIDASGGALVTSVGHGNREVLQSIFRQMEQASYVSGMQFCSQVLLDFCEKLAKLAKPTGLDRVQLLCSGSEATEAAVKFARQLWVERGQPTKQKFIARSPGYHGNTLFALSASARPYYRKFFAGLLSDVIMIDTPYPYRTPVKDYAKDGADYYAGLLEQAILKAGPENVAGFLVETVVGSSGGASLPPPGYFDKVQEICRKHNVLIIADEVMCGAGRTGKFFACEHFGLKPDLLTMGKGINGGYAPVSVLMARDAHVQEMKAGSGGFMHAQTYMQTPMMAATGLAILEYFEKNKVVENCAKVGAYFQKKLRDEVLPLAHVGSIQGIGLMAGVEFVQDKASKKPFARSEKKAEGMVAHAFAKGLTLWPNVSHADGTNGDLVMLGPPLIITEKQVDELIALLKESITSFFGK